MGKDACSLLFATFRVLFSFASAALGERRSKSQLGPAVRWSSLSTDNDGAGAARMWIRDGRDKGEGWGWGAAGRGQVHSRDTI